MDDDERVTYLGTGIASFEAAKRYLRKKYRQPPMPPVEHRPGRLFYVTVRDGGRTGALLGPYVSHMTALANVPRGRRLAQEASEWAHFYAYGTASLPAGRRPKTTFGR